MEITPSTKTLKKRPDVAPLNMCIYKVTDNAGDVWSKFKDCTMTKLWQIQFDHNAIPSISYQLGNVLDEFHKEKSSANEEYPKNRDELFRDGGVVLEFSNSNDPDNAGARTWHNGYLWRNSPYICMLVRKFWNSLCHERFGMTLVLFDGVELFTTLVRIKHKNSLCYTLEW